MPLLAIDMNGFEPTLLDKLCDDSPTLAVQKRLSIDELKDSVARDLESLLNTRTTFRDALTAEFPEVARSVASYGMEDFAGLSLASVNDRSRICRSLESAINRHEPRLTRVQVSLELSRHSINSLLFSIRALLVVNPAQEPVSFDALLQPTTLQYSVNRHRNYGVVV